MLFRTVLLSAALTVLATGPLAAQDGPKPGRFESGSRAGPFVATDKSLTDLTGDGYEIRGNLGTSLILQKGVSVYSCQIPPDPEALGFKPYFVCAELREEKRDATAADETPLRGN
ncbi:hypothetical protein [Parvibaculum sp.]|uniref:hypothetical protein n=1 Tax=Parvibaculum sp. TaxID=2024848 RepID=UPI00391A23B6